MPTVSIIGRPNVGKSSLFNRIIRKRHAIVDDVAGVTRDRNYAQAEWGGYDFTIIDTGGLLPGSKEALPREIQAQADEAMAESNVIIFLLEVGTGPTDIDLEIARKLKKTSADRTILVVNKAESKQAQYDIHDFIRLGMGEPLAISALHGSGVAELLDTVIDLFSKQGFVPNESHVVDTSLKIAILGRPNAGKSSLVNRLLNRQRMIVDSVAGTTRDSIDSTMRYHEKEIVLIDTAGLRKKARIKDDVEYHSTVRALDTIERADVCAVLIDAVAGIGEQDMTIIQKVLESHKGLIVCWNKWDIMEKDSKTFDHMVAEARHRFAELRHAPMISLSALTGQRIYVVLDTAFEIKERMRTKIPGKELRDNVFEWSTRNPHPVVGTKAVRILGARQQNAEYPFFFLFASNAGLGLPSYARYIANKIYDTYGFEGCPVVVKYKQAAKPGRTHKPSDE